LLVYRSKTSTFVEVTHAIGLKLPQLIIKIVICLRDVTLEKRILHSSQKMFTMLNGNKIILFYVQNNRNKALKNKPKQKSSKLRKLRVTHVRKSSPLISSSKQSC
jgi:hypothetical protein